LVLGSLLFVLCSSLLFVLEENMYEVGVVAQFEAAHRLVGDFGLATRLHGHTYRLEAIVRGTQLHENGVLFDITKLQAALDRLIGKLHYQNLNDVPELHGVNTTVESMAHFCWEQLAPTLRGQGLTTLRVQIWENERAWAARQDEL
jgi:6-pyruvoyltetrahydropterin/6-carboxytetrahydropterin synthase